MTLEDAIVAESRIGAKTEDLVDQISDQGDDGECDDRADDVGHHSHPPVLMLTPWSPSVMTNVQLELFAQASIACALT